MSHPTRHDPSPSPQPPLVELRELLASLPEAQAETARKLGRVFDELTAQHALAERYRVMVEAVGDAVLATDAERRVVYANPAARELFGTQRSLTGRPLDELVPPETPEPARAIAQAPCQYDAVLRGRDGDRRYVSVSTAPLHEHGAFAGVVVSLRDLTEERRARGAVAHSEARYRNLFETATDAIYTLDARGAFTSVNRATLALTGVAGAAELLGRSAFALVDPAEREAIRARFEGALAGQAAHFECHLLRPDGGQRLLSVTNTPIRHGREVVGVLGIARDVTTERARAAALERSEARYTRLVESASDAIFTVDALGALTSVNRALERTLGRPRDALLGADCVTLVDPRDRDGMREILRSTLGGARQRGELRYADAEGRERTGSIISTPIVEGGRVTGALGVVRDVTDERRIAEQLLQQEKLAAIGQLVSGVAHELNNPLAGVLAFAQLLLSTDGMSADEREAVETIHDEAKRAAKIVSNLLTVARQHPPERRAVDLNAVLEDTLELRRYALRMQQIELELALDPALPVTWADPFQLQQVVLNLVTNAEQALAEWTGARRLRVASAFESATLRITIADSGPGIPAGQEVQIFNPFYTTKAVGSGTGLGLSISDGIVREHGGRIRVESTAGGGGGASFVIELPLADPWEHGAAPAADEGLAAPGAPARECRGQTVLVVDDEPSIRSALATYLRGEGCQVDVAGSGDDALTRLSERWYDVVLLDLRMPGASGAAVYAELERRDPAQAGRVVFVTGDVESDASRRFVRSTGRPCLHKPFTLQEIAGALAGAAA